MKVGFPLKDPPNKQVSEALGDHEAHFDYHYLGGGEGTLKPRREWARKEVEASVSKLTGGENL